MNGVEDVTFSSINVPFSGNGYNTAVSYEWYRNMGQLYTLRKIIMQNFRHESAGREMVFEE